MQLILVARIGVDIFISFFSSETIQCGAIMIDFYHSKIQNDITGTVLPNVTCKCLCYTKYVKHLYCFFECRSFIILIEWKHCLTNILLNIITVRIWLIPTSHPQFKIKVATHTSSFWEILWSSGDSWKRRRGRWEFVRCPASGESDLNHKRLLLIFCFKHYAFQQFLCLFAILREDCHEMNLKGIFKIKAQKTFLWGRELSVSGGDEGGLIAFEWIRKGKQRANGIHGCKLNTKLCTSLTICALHAAVHSISLKNISH